MCKQLGFFGRLIGFNISFSRSQKHLKMPKQSLDVIDYFGPLAAALIFASILFILSVTVILHCLVTKNDDPTVFSKFGLGPRPLAANTKSHYTSGHLYLDFGSNSITLS
ncbi:Neuropeptide-like peptide 36 [Aphelenchoides besseyi]|nr:Neuropeptide-like peptide 36 [Aphelenchoides besseyi]